MGLGRNTELMRSKIGGLFMGKTVYLSDKEIDFLDRALEGLVVDEEHDDSEVCDLILEKIHKQKTFAL